MATEEEIKREFNSSGFKLIEEEEILKRCVTFCINYSLKPSNLVSSWELYHLNRQLPEQTVQKDEMDGFLLHLQNEQKESIIEEESGLHIYSSRDVDMLLDGVYEDTNNGVSTPTDKSHRLHSDPYDSINKTKGYGYSTGKSVEHVTPFGRRTDKFVVKFNIDNLAQAENGINDDQEICEDDIIKRVQTSQRCSLKIHGSGPEPGCRFMYDRIEDRFNALENRIARHADAYVASGLYEEPVDPAVASQRSIFSVGMICCDGEGHLNEKSILLQSSAERASGLRVRLDLSRVDQFSIFPGQIVGVEGHNPSGHCLVASKLVDTVPLTVTAETDVPPVKKQTMDQEVLSAEESCKGSEVSFIIAAGPFTTTDNLMFEPLNELLAYARRKSPQLLVLLGPFVDSEHPEIKEGKVDATFEEVFRTEILRKLEDYAEYMGSGARVIVVPSIRDANHDYVFPQPPFDIQIPKDLEEQIRSMSNPGKMEANEVKVGWCSEDVLKHLSGVEFARYPPSGVVSHRMSTLASHLLRQRCYYPVYPAAERVPLDLSLAPGALHISPLPHILILPSDMRYFIKVLSVEEGEEGECVCVNPGRLAKGEGGGTFVELHYRASSPPSLRASIIAI